MASREEQILEEIRLLNLKIERITILEEAEKVEKEKTDKSIAKFTSHLNKVYEGSDERWAEAVEKKISRINSSTSASQTSKSRSKAKTTQASKSRGKAKSKPKHKLDSQGVNKKFEATPPVLAKEVADVTTVRSKDSIESVTVEEVVGEKLQTVVKNDSEVEVKKVRANDSFRSIDVSYCFGNHQGSGLYEGTRSSRNFSKSRSFIEAKPSQVDNIHDLIEISSSSIYIVTTDDLIIDDHEIIPLLVTEPVVSLNSFFEVEAESFLCENIFDAGAKSRWWAHISKRFRCIFGNVVHGLIYLHSLGQKCGDLKNNIYVSANDEGKILPLMDKKRSEAYDVLNLIKKMKEIITLPFPETEVDEAYQLPDELTHLLQFVTTDKLKDIPFDWLVNHPYFWSSQERITFVMELRNVIKRDLITEKDIDISLLYDTPFWAHSDGNPIDWSKMINKRACNKLFKLIYNKSLLENVRKYDPEHPCEIIRYMCNSYNHANDNDYRRKTRSKVRYSPDQIESFLRSFFPKIYVSLYAVLCHFLITIQSTMAKTQFCRAFENWSSLYFAPKTLAASLYKGKQNFRLPQAGPSVSRSSPFPSLRALCRCAKELGNEQIVIPVKEEVMNQIQDLYFGREEIIQLLEKDELDATHISTYIRLLYEVCVKEGLTETFGFLCPSRISSAIVSKDAKLVQMDREKRHRYILNALLDDKASDGKLYLAPCNIGRHWILCLINPYESTVYYLDPLSGQGREIEQDLCNVVEMALRLYWKQEKKSITWKQIQCPQQNNMVDCGYYVLRFMREVVDHRSVHIPETYFADCARPTYDQSQINSVRDELACHALRFYVKPERA